MSMIKTFSPNGWDFDCETAAMVKVASGGLRGHDRREFLKRASGAENIFLPYIDQIKFASGEVPVHLIAVGADEIWGRNRNGDGFPKKACIRYHDTFVKLAKSYRNHKNRQPENSYGVVKCSAWNTKMARIELLLGLNSTKEAAERNNGFVADEELQKLEKEGSFAVSMACRVPFDVCTSCGNRARTRAEYCKEASCPAGGCADNLARWVKVAGDLHHLGVLNDHPSFFDISKVWRPAERTAYGTYAVGFDKAASDDYYPVPSLEVFLAQEEFVPRDLPYFSDLVKLAHGLAALEEDVSFEPPSALSLAFAASVQPPLDISPFGADTPTKAAAALEALASEKIVLPLREFASLTGREADIKTAAAQLPGIYRRLICRDELEHELMVSPFSKQAAAPSLRQKEAASTLAPRYSLDPAHVRERATRAALRGESYFSKLNAASCDFECDLAKSYALYKLAALRKIAETDDNFLATCQMHLAQNWA